ncbi:MAG: hypothetical protein Q8R47_04925 [Nanoarchaeota archaeon]|nr:hypothetical protein [Nanoarchaeota archaeon]
MDVNEEIVKQWLHSCKQQFTIDDIRFKVFGPKGGSNYSNVDLLAVDKAGKYYDYEIKWRSVYSLGATDKETPAALINQMLRKERVEKIKSIIGRKPYQKIFITTYQMFGRSQEKRDKFVKIFNSNKIQVLFFEEIIKELVSAIDVKGRYDSEVLQTIRMIKYFDLLKESLD